MRRWRSTVRTVQLAVNPILAERLPDKTIDRRNSTDYTEQALPTAREFKVVAKKTVKPIADEPRSTNAHKKTAPCNSHESCTSIDVVSYPISNSQYLLFYFFKNQ